MNYHGRIMNIAGYPSATGDYKVGHRDARHAAAEIAAEADAEIARLNRKVDGLVEALAEVKATVDGDSDQPVRDIIYGYLAERATEEAA